MSEKVSVEERLNDIISEKENEINSLEDKIASLEHQLDYHKWSWCRHQIIEDDEFYKDIPYPRLEMFLKRISENSWYEIEWVYGIVYKHFSDAGYNNKLLFIPFSQTNSRGGGKDFTSHFHDGKLELPFRDGLHIKTEAQVLNLPAYISCRENGIIQKIDTNEDTDHVLDVINKMKK